MEYSAAFVVLLGLGTVFVGLILLVFLTLLMGRIMTAVDKSDAAAPAPAVSAPTPAQMSAGDADQLAAAVAAAIAEDLGTDITGIRIVSMKRI